MNWTEEETEYLLKHYPNTPSIWEISNHLGKTVKALHRKAQRLKLKRKVYTKKPKPKKPRKEIYRDHYKKNKKEIYLRKYARRIKIRNEAKKLLGNKCSICGYNKCNNALEFHHQGGDKEGHVSRMIKNLSRHKVLKEIKKCILVCANCHREIHGGVSYKVSTSSSSLKSGG